MSTQTPCSQFCVEPAASVVDASAVWHWPASVPDDSGCIVLHTLQLLDAGERRVVEYRAAVVSLARIKLQARSVYNRWRIWRMVCA